MNIKTAFTSIIITSLLTLTTAAQADSHYADNDKDRAYSETFNSEKHQDRKKKRLERMAKKLNLSEQQKVQIQTLRQNHQNEAKPLRSEKRALRKELRQLDPNDGSYSAKLADIANRQAVVVRQLTILKGNKRQQMSKILTPEQLSKRKKMHSKRKRQLRKKHRKLHNKGL